MEKYRRKFKLKYLLSLYLLCTGKGWLFKFIQHNPADTDEGESYWLYGVHMPWPM